MNPSRLTLRWNRRWEKLQASLAGLRKRSRARGGVEDVHALRVNLRRLRLLARLAKPFFNPAALRRFQHWARRVAEVTGPVRDLDIALAWLRDHEAGQATAQQIAGVRAAQWGRRRAAATRPPPPCRPRRQPTGRCDAKVIAKRLARLEARYREQVEQGVREFSRLSEDRQHEFRRAVRWWRYLCEFGMSARELRRDRLFLALFAVQQALGELRDLGLVQAHVTNSVPAAGRAALLAALAQDLRRRRLAAEKALRRLQRRLG